MPISHDRPSLLARDDIVARNGLASCPPRSSPPLERQLTKRGASTIPRFSTQFCERKSGLERIRARGAFTLDRDFSPVRDSVHALDSRDLAQIGHRVLPETDIDSRPLSRWNNGFYVAVR